MIGDYDLYIERSSVMGVCLYLPFHIFLFIFITFHVLSIADRDLFLLKAYAHIHTKELLSKSFSKILI